MEEVLNMCVNCQHLLLGLPASRAIRSKHMLFKLPSLWYFCYSTWTDHDDPRFELNHRVKMFSKTANQGQSGEHSSSCDLFCAELACLPLPEPARMTASDTPVPSPGPQRRSPSPLGHDSSLGTRVHPEASPGHGPCSPWPGPSSARCWRWQMPAGPLRAAQAELCWATVLVSTSPGKRMRWREDESKDVSSLPQEGGKPTEEKTLMPALLSVRRMAAAVWWMQGRWLGVQCTGLFWWPQETALLSPGSLSTSSQMLTKICYRSEVWVTDHTSQTTDSKSYTQSPQQRLGGQWPRMSSTESKTHLWRSSSGPGTGW